MNTLTQEMLSRFELLADDMQYEAIDFINFLIEKSKKQQAKVLLDDTNKDLKQAIAEGLNGQVRDAEEIFDHLENKYNALANGVFS